MVELRVTYTVATQDRVIVIENVPARVCLETGAQIFSPETVERIHAIVRGGSKPSKVLQTPVYEFGA